ncbi:hypothetical protein A3F06_01705 [candidate division TM6 bacterium RIFCSPHIGHO2_12_FULL_36_22]|nr:MAG: hypothetical protein A3F06_01705 [candidate division TM6 bacterium RIFCSPHIGHO2_12_FULL_36_22]
MKFIKDLTQQLDHSWWSSCSLLCFSGSSYPFLFLAAWQQKLKMKLKKRFVVCDITKQELSILKGSLGTSFLGESCIYYLGDLSQLPTKKQEAWELYLNQYAGPHCLIFFSDKPKIAVKNNTAVHVELPDWLNQKEYMELLKLCWPVQDYVRCRFLAMAVIKQYGRVSLDQGYLLGHYGLLLGNNIDEFMDNWVEAIIPNEGSLFELSAALLSGKRDEFFQQYASLKDIYPLPFWVSFWSEQLFRAIYYVQYKNENRVAEAKQIGFRLPFSFLQKDWRLASLSKLNRSHDLLYKIDFDFKNGGSEILLDNFYFHML